MTDIQFQSEAFLPKGYYKNLAQEFFTLNQNLVLGLALPPLIEVKDFDKTRRRLLLRLYQSSVNVTMKASLTKRKSVLKIVKKGKFQKPRFDNISWKQNLKR